jgi:hypothetical protein
LSTIKARTNSEVFGNLKDDNARLNEHTEICLEELSYLTQKWQRAKIDARAVFASITTFKNYYEVFARKRLGDNYVMALEAQASKLSDEMLARDSRN